MDLRTRLFAVIAAVTLLGVFALGGAPALLAQEATPAAVAGRPAHIHAGTCDTLGEVLQPLTPLTALVGTSEGLASAIPAETSFTEAVPMSLDDILAGEHAVNVHLSQEEIGTYIACGDIGGVRNAQGAIVIGLQELNDSGFTGIAFLVPNAADPATTDVSVFIAEGLAGGALDLGTPEA